MMRRAGWIRILGLLCAGVCGASLVMAQTQGKTNNKVVNQPQPAARRPAPATTAPKAAQTNAQKQPAKTAQPQPAASTSSPGSVDTHPITSGQSKGSSTTAPTQPAPGAASPPSPYTYQQPTSAQPKVTPAQPSTPAQTPANGAYFPAGTTKNSGITDGPPPRGSGTNGQTQPSGSGCGQTTTGSTTIYDLSFSRGGTPPGCGPQGSAPGGQTQPSTTGQPGQVSTKGPPKPPPHGQPNRPTPQPWPPYVPQPVRPTPTLPGAGIPAGMFPTHGGGPHTPSVAPPSTSAPPAIAQQPDNVQQPPQQQSNTQQPSSPTPRTATSGAPQSDVPKPQHPVEPSSGGGGQDGVVSETLPTTVTVGPVALTLTTRTSRPVVGKDVVVVAALEPAQAGVSYRLDWGDGSEVETVSDSGKHRYAKAKMYKVSASTRVGSSELNHEILLQVGPVVVWPRIAALMALLAGLAFGGMHLFVPKLTASFRWGAPEVPEMRLLSREPYASLSFEPGVGPAEEEITFSKK